MVCVGCLAASLQNDSKQSENKRTHRNALRRHAGSSMHARVRRMRGCAWGGTRGHASWLQVARLRVFFGSPTFFASSSSSVVGRRRHRRHLCRAQKMLKANEINCGAELLKLLLNAHEQTSQPINDETVARLVTVFDAVPAEKYNENKIIALAKQVSTWSQTEDSEHGSAVLHNLFGAKYRAAQVCEQCVSVIVVWPARVIQCCAELSCCKQSLSAWLRRKPTCCIDCRSM